MSEPTEYDLQQDQRIIPLEEILSQAAEPPTGDEYSYPVVGQGWSTDMWRWMTRGIGSGILGEGGRPYWLDDFSNATNTAQLKVSTTIGTANATIAGFYHQLSQDMTINLPPVSTATTYRICLTYDPRDEKDVRGPISVQTYTTDLPTTFGREHVLLWSVRRDPSGVLTDAQVTRHRPFVAPVLSTNSSAEFPPPDTVLTGTVAMGRHDSTIMTSMMPNEPDEDGNVSSSGRWIDMLDRPWVSLGLNSFYAPGGAVPTQIQRRGKTRILRGQFRRANQSESLSAGNRWFVATLPTRDRPYSRVKIPVATSNDTVTATIDIMANGEVYFITPRAVGWATLDGIEYDVA